MSKYLIAALLTLVLGVSSFAGKQHRHEISDELVGYVQMTDSQRMQVQELRDSMHAQKKELKVMEKADRHAAKTSMKERYRAELGSILSEAQLAKYDEYRHMNKRKHKSKKNKEKTEVM